MIMKDTLTMESGKIMAQKKENYSQKDVKVKQPPNLSISTLFIWKSFKKKIQIKKRPTYKKSKRSTP